MSLTPDQLSWLSNYTSQVAAELTLRILDAAGKRVARLFRDEPRQAALSAAIAQGLTEAIGCLPLADVHREHYLSLFGEFMQRDAVVEELSQIVDPRPEARLNMDLLREEFIAAGFDPGYIEFDEVVQSFVGAFYDAAAKDKELQGAIEIGVLRQIAESIGALQWLAARQTVAAELSAARLSELVELTERMARGQGDVIQAVKAIRDHGTSGPGAQLDAYQQAAAGLGRAGRYVTIDPNGRVTIAVEPAAEASPSVDLSPMRDMLEELWQALVRPDRRPSPEEIAAREARYRELIKTSFCNLRLEGLSTGVRPIILPLERVYVHLRAVAEVPEAADVFTPEERRVLRLIEEGRREEEFREAQLLLDAIRRERWTKERLERFPIADALRDPLRRGLVILGDPGSGKTTLLQFLALIFARGSQDVAQHLKLAGPEADRLPIFAPLASYDEMLGEGRELTIREFLARYYDRRRAAPGLESVFEGALNAGRALVLLDGLDEVIEEGRRRFVSEQASAFIREAMSNGNRVLLTSRIYGYRAAPLSVDLPHITVLDFRREEIEIFARQWCRAMAEWDAGRRVTPQTELLAQEEERRLLTEIRSNPGVERLAVNPLLLTMLALLRRQVGGLPQRRIQLYDLYVRALVQNWEENRSRGARLTAPRHTDTLEAETVLIPLSFWLQQNKPSGTATREDLMVQLVRIFLEDAGENPDTTDVAQPARRNAERRAEAFLSDMRQFSGLLIERGQNAFGFRHLTFQEYFAGRALARMQPDERWALLKPNLHSNRWREPILLAVARLGVTENRGAEVTHLIEQILDAGSGYEPILYRDLFLAAECAADDIGVDLRALRRLVGRLEPLATSRIPSVAARAVDLLSRFGLLRAGENVRLPEALDALVPALDADRPANRSALLHAVSRVWRASDRLTESTHRFVVRDAVRSPHRSPEEYGDLAGFLRASAALRTAVVAKLDDREWDVRVAAVEALAGLVGEDATLRTAVIAKLDDEDNEVRAAAVEALAGLVGEDAALRAAVVAKLDDREWYMRGAAVRALAGLVGEDAALRAAVVAKLDDEEGSVRWAAVEALAGLVGKDAALRAAVVAKLDDEEWFVRWPAVEALAGLVGEDAALRAAVVAKLDDKEGDVRGAAVEALSSFIGKDVSITETICGLLSHRDWHTRRDAVNGLFEIVREQMVPPRLIENVLSDLRCVEASRGCGASVRALAGLVGEDATLRAVVVAKLDDKEGFVRRAAVEALAGLLGKDAALRAAVVAKLDNEESYVRVAVLEALAGLVGEDAALRAAVVAKLDDRQGYMRAAAVRALAGLVGEDAALRAAVVAKLDDEEGYVRGTAVEALAGLVGKDAALRAAVVAKLDDEEWFVRRAVVEALAELVGEDAALRAAVVAKLDDKDGGVRGAAVRALAGLAGEDAALRAVVVAKLDDEERYVRWAVVEALAGLVGKDAALRAAVVAKLDDKEGDVRGAAVEALAGLMGEDAALRAAVVAKLDDKEGDVRRAAVRVLAGLVGEDAALRAAVVAKLDDEHVVVRAEAVYALAPLASVEPEMRDRLMPALGIDDQEVGYRRRRTDEAGPREVLVRSLGEWVARDTEGRSEIAQLLSAEDWRVRQSAVEVFVAAGKDRVHQMMPQILAVLDDHRGLDSWPARIAAAEVLLNDYRYSETSIQTILPALDYGAHPLVIVRDAEAVRRQAALALGKLKAEYRQPRVFSRLERLLLEERDPQVLGGAFNALLSLASAPELA